MRLRVALAVMAVVAVEAASTSGLAGPGATPTARAQDEPPPLVAEVRTDGGPSVTLPLEASDPVGFIFADLAEPGVVVHVINGCALNDRYWVFATNLGARPATLTLRTAASGIDRRFTLPAHDDGRPAEPVIGLEALPICDEVGGSVAGIGSLEGTATFTGVGDGCADSSIPVSLIPRDRGGTFREVRLGDGGPRRVIADEPVVILDDAGADRDIILFAEARLPGRVEGVAVSGGGRLLPARSALDRRIGDLTDGRVRRAFETAVNGRVPRAILRDLGLRQVRCVHHVRLDFDDPDATDRLFAAGWLKADPERSEPADGDDPVESDAGEPGTNVGREEDARFVAETVDAGGRFDEIPLLSAPSERDSTIRTWTFQDGETLAQVIDGCPLTGAFWVLVGSRSEASFELTLHDRSAGESRTFAVPQALGGALAPAVVDTAAFRSCR